MSILSTASDFKKGLTPTLLKEAGFTKIPWGSPDVQGIYKVNCYSRTFKTKPKWKPEHKCWELCFDGIKDSGSIYFFSKGFTSYVTSFHGAPPAYTVMVAPNNCEDEMFSNINNIMDLNILISKILKKYKAVKLSPDEANLY